MKTSSAASGRNGKGSRNNVVKQKPKNKLSGRKSGTEKKLLQCDKLVWF